MVRKGEEKGGVGCIGITLRLLGIPQMLLGITNASWYSKLLPDIPQRLQGSRSSKKRSSYSTSIPKMFLGIPNVLFGIANMRLGIPNILLDHTSYFIHHTSFILFIQ